MSAQVGGSGAQNQAYQAAIMSLAAYGAHAPLPMATQHRLTLVLPAAAAWPTNKNRAVRRRYYRLRLMVPATVLCGYIRRCGGLLARRGGYSVAMASPLQAMRLYRHR